MISYSYGMNISESIHLEDLHIVIFVIHSSAKIIELNSQNQKFYLLADVTYLIFFIS